MAVNFGTALGMYSEIEFQCPVCREPADPLEMKSEYGAQSGLRNAPIIRWRCSGCFGWHVLREGIRAIKSSGD